jgi:hypothetical protein
VEVLRLKSNCGKICLNLFHKNSTSFTSIIALFLNFSSKLEGIIIAGGEYFSLVELVVGQATNNGAESSAFSGETSA